MRVVSLEITGSGYLDLEQDPGGFSRGSTGVGGAYALIGVQPGFLHQIYKKRS